MSHESTPADIIDLARVCLRRPRIVGFAALLLLAALGPQATAQNPALGQEPTPGCRVPSASRAKATCEPKELVIRTEKEVTFSLALPAPKTVHCAATTEIQYTQRGAKVSVEGTIENNDCAASDGEYKLAVRVRDENSESKTLEFFESWQRQDDQPVKFRGDYPIGENVDIVNVRTIQVRCTCTDTPEE